MTTITVWFLIAFNVNTGETYRSGQMPSATECLNRRDSINLDREFTREFPEVHAECVPRTYLVR